MKLTLPRHGWHPCSLILLFVFGTSAGEALSQDLASDTSPSITYDAGFVTGIGQFPIINLPVDPETGDAIDGQQPSVSEQALGIPIGLSGSLERKLSPSTVARAELGLIRASALRSGASSSRTYGRYQVGVGLAYSGMSEPIALGLLVRHKRTTYADGSQTHILERELAGIDLSWPIAKGLVTAWGAIPVAAKFGFNSHGGLHGKSVPGSSASGYETGLGFSRSLSKHTSFQVGYQFESYRVEVPDVGAYGQFGFSLAGYFEGSQMYQLNSNFATLTLSRLF